MHNYHDNNSKEYRRNYKDHNEFKEYRDYRDYHNYNGYKDYREYREYRHEPDPQSFRHSRENHGPNQKFNKTGEETKNGSYIDSESRKIHQNNFNQNKYRENDEQYQPEIEIELQKELETVLREGDFKNGGLPNGYSIFVGNLGVEIDHTFLLGLFQKNYSSVLGGKIIIDPSTGASKGCGFVTFGVEEEQNQAIREMQGRLCGERPMRISPARRRI